MRPSPFVRLISVAALALLAAATPAFGQDGYIFTTLAGQPGVSGAADGNSGAAQFKNPLGVAADSAGTLYVADEGNALIRKITPAGAVSTFAGRAGEFAHTDGSTTIARFGAVVQSSDGTSFAVGPTGVAIAPNGTVYVADAGASAIRLISGGSVSSLSVTRQSMSGGGQPPSSAFRRPYSLAFDREGNPLIADPNSNAVFRVTLRFPGPGQFYAAEGISATLRLPAAVAAHSDGRIFVADSGTFTIRQVFPDGTSSLLAGRASEPGSSDGQGANARFNGVPELVQLASPVDALISPAVFGPSGVALDSQGNLFVTDLFSHTIRRISPDAQVTTIAGSAGQAGSADGVGSTTRFRFPAAIAVDGAGNVYVADSGNHTIRKGSPAYLPRIESHPAHLSVNVGQPFTLSVTATGSLPQTFQWSKDGVVLGGETSSSLRRSPAALSDAGEYSVTIRNQLGAVTSRSARVSVGAGLLFSAQPQDLTLTAGSSGTLAASITVGATPTYQWKKDGVDIPGANSGSLVLSEVGVSSAGVYTLVATAGGSSVTSLPAIVRVLPYDAGRLANMSIRTSAGTGENVLIVGAGIGGSGTKSTKAVLLRGIGPTLAAFGVAGALPDPVLTIFRGPTQIAQNDDWNGGFNFGSVGAFDFVGTAPRDAALYRSAIETGSYTVQIAGKDSGVGIALAEIYDATPAPDFALTTPRLVNVSARTFVGTGDNILIAGFVIAGSTPLRVLIRASGPAIAALGVDGAITDPQLDVFDSANRRVASNDNWGGTAALKAAFAASAAFAFPSDGSRDAALVTELAPGNYTAQITGTGQTTGIALVEIYELP